MRQGEEGYAYRSKVAPAMRKALIVPPSIEAIGAVLAAVPVERLRLWKAFEPDRHPRWPSGQLDGGRFRSRDDAGGNTDSAAPRDGAGADEPSTHPEIDALNVVGCGAAPKLCLNSGIADRLRCVAAFNNCMSNGTHAIFAPGIVGRSGS
jgi:hypothetical protein